MEQILINQYILERKKDCHIIKYACNMEWKSVLADKCTCTLLKGNNINN
jgi:hypothetical protein